MHEFKAIGTGRPCFVDLASIVAVTDAINMQPARVVGADPTAHIVGAIIYVAGAQIGVEADATELAHKILFAKGQTPALSSILTQ